jgi:hypothetical protein
LGASAKNGNSNNDKSSKSSEAGAKNKSKTLNLKNFEKPDKTKGETHAQLHKEKTEKVVKNLEQVANQEESVGNTEVSEEIEKVVLQEEQVQDDTVEAIEEVENDGKAKKFFLGPDYKNLGQLRSSLVHNRNQIRKLTQTMSQVQSPEDAALLQEQLADLMGERARIRTVIDENESSFSLFGWVSRFINSYEETPINEEEENDLVEEVEDAIDNAPTEPEEPVVPTEPVVPGDQPATPVEPTTPTETTPTETIPSL